MASGLIKTWKEDPIDRSFMKNIIFIHSPQNRRSKGSFLFFSSLSPSRNQTSVSRFVVVSFLFPTTVMEKSDIHQFLSLACGVAGKRLSPSPDLKFDSTFKLAFDSFLFENPNPKSWFLSTHRTVIDWVFSSYVQVTCLLLCYLYRQCKFFLSKLNQYIY